MQKALFYTISSMLFFISCKKEVEVKENFLKSGPWKATLELPDSQELPFLFEVFENQNIKIFNAEEVIDVDELNCYSSACYM